MEVDRQQWIARAELTSVEIKMERTSRRTWSVTVIGRDQAKRKRLWRWGTDYTPSESALAVGENVGHFVACVVLDEPSSESALQRALVTQWTDVPLWPEP